jgi:hypothetical protein
LKENDIKYSELDKEAIEEVQKNLLQLLYDECYYISENNVIDHLDTI